MFMRFSRFIILISIFSGFSGFSQQVSIISDKVKKERKAEANRIAYNKKVNNAWVIAQQQNDIESYKTFLREKFSTNYNQQALQKIFGFTNETNTIKAYEDYIALGYKHKKREAISQIYKLVKEIDAIDGYRYFLKKHPSATETKQASDRLYEIMYAFTEDENTISAYEDFLKNFSKAPKIHRVRALMNSIILEAEQNSQKLTEIDVNDQSKEKLARRIYAGASRARDENNKIAFLRKYNTIVYSPLFSDTEVAFEISRDKEITDLIMNIKIDIVGTQYSIQEASLAIAEQCDQILGTLTALFSKQTDTSNLNTNSGSEFEKRLLNHRNKQNDGFLAFYNRGQLPSAVYKSPKPY